MKLAHPHARDTEEGPMPAAPPRTEGVVPLPRSERGGSGAAAQGVLTISGADRDDLRRLAAQAHIHMAHAAVEICGLVAAQLHRFAVLEQDAHPAREIGRASCRERV